MEQNDILLIFPMEEHRQMWEEILADYEAAGEKAVPFALKLKCDKYDAFLHKTIDFANGIIPPDLPHLVQATTWFLMNKEKNKILGAVNIRHFLNEYLLKVGGHIGYGIAPSERRKGYAARMLSLALDKCREIGIEKVLVTCNKDNIGSAKTILKNGGILENEYKEENNNIVQRYWINIGSELDVNQK